MLGGGSHAVVDSVILREKGAIQAGRVTSRQPRVDFFTARFGQKISNLQAVDVKVTALHTFRL